MEVRVNGTWCEVADGTTVTGLLAALGVPAAGVAVDGQVCGCTRHAATVLVPGAEVEVLTAAQGG